MIYCKDVCFLARTLNEMAACTALEGKAFLKVPGRAFATVHRQIDNCDFLEPSDAKSWLTLYLYVAEANWHIPMQIYFFLFEKKIDREQGGAKKKTTVQRPGKKSIPFSGADFLPCTCIGCPLSKQCSSSARLAECNFWHSSCLFIFFRSSEGFCERDRLPHSPFI